MIGKVAAWRRATKAKLVEGFGGKCNRCGYDKYAGAMDFHHIYNLQFVVQITE